MKESNNEPNEPTELKWQTFESWQAGVKRVNQDRMNDTRYVDARIL